jgi:four helix bundle protein
MLNHRSYIGEKTENDRREREEEGRRTRGRKKTDEKGTKKIRTVRDLKVYRKAFDSAMEIFELTKKFPKEEKYSLTDQIRRASRAVCSNLSEAWRKRRYKAVFLNKLTDSGQEAAETQTWLEFSLCCKYIDEDTFQRLDDEYEHIFAMLNAMENKVDTFCRPSS